LDATFCGKARVAGVDSEFLSCMRAQGNRNMFLKSKFRGENVTAQGKTVHENRKIAFKNSKMHVYTYLRNFSFSSKHEESLR
jgi:CRISPR/Cas system-associated exonuclease Cas4 (RecB family)